VGQFKGKSTIYVDQPKNTSKNLLHVLNGARFPRQRPILKEALNALILKVSTKSELKGQLDYQEEAVVHLILVFRSNTQTRSHLSSNLLAVLAQLQPTPNKTNLAAQSKYKYI
jgi:hypothetical protein